MKSLPLQNRVVMAPMTRTRASVTTDVPNAMMGLYYAQRASAGLIITEATHISPQAIGYQNVPGIFSEQQVNGWKIVTSAVHQMGGKIFIQLFHTGRLSHPYFQPGGMLPVAPSAIQANGPMAFIRNYHHQAIQIPFALPKALSADDIKAVIGDFAVAARHAIEAGFDGVEIHAANGYLLEQFLNPHSNKRTDSYGGSIENRSRIVLDTVDAVATVIGKEKIGVRLSPFGTLHDMQPYAEAEQTHLYLAGALQQRDIAYLHIFDQAAFGTAEIPNGFLDKVRSRFQNTLMLCGGYTPEKAEEALQTGIADLIAFGRPFIGNPDLVEKIQSGIPLLDSDRSYWYGVNGIEGYITHA